MGISNRLSTFDYVISSTHELELYAKIIWVSLVAQMIENLCAMQETRAQSLGQEDPLEKGMATHSSILVWRIPWTEEGVQSRTRLRQ